MENQLKKKNLTEFDEKFDVMEFDGMHYGEIRKERAKDALSRAINIQKQQNFKKLTYTPLQISSVKKFKPFDRFKLYLDYDRLNELGEK